VELGDKVVVMKSWHSDVYPGVVGTVVKKMSKGYAVEIKACFAVATGEKSISTRHIFFLAEQIKRVRSRSADKRRAKTDDDTVIGGS
jgi:ribosomal protein L21E